MRKIIECVMNISEGRKRQTLRAVASAIESVPRAFLLNYQADRDHHRAVYSFIGDPTSVVGATLAASGKAVELIDLRTHRGEHPRLGAVDVIPLVPIRGVSVEDCIGLARKLGEQLGRKLEIPVYLYERAATCPSRRNLAWIRKAIGSYRPGDVVTDPAHKPDFGPNRLHPTAGATSVGARTALIAFNIFLETSDVEISRRIAALVRESGGGLPGVRALGFFIAGRNQAQVSMNVTDPQRSGLRKIFRCVEEHAKTLQTGIAGSEIIGLISRQWLGDEDIAVLRLEGFGPQQILENSIQAALQAGG